VWEIILPFFFFFFFFFDRQAKSFFNPTLLRVMHMKRKKLSKF